MGCSVAARALRLGSALWRLLWRAITDSADGAPLSEMRGATCFERACWSENVARRWRVLIIAVVIAVFADLRTVPGVK